MQVRGLIFDWHDDAGPLPAPGDVLESHRRRDDRPTGTRYAILVARVIKRREPEPGMTRLALGVVRVGAVLDDARIVPLYWHARGRG